jgi:hypothetical protein
MLPLTSYSAERQLVPLDPHLSICATKGAFKPASARKRGPKGLSLSRERGFAFRGDTDAMRAGGGDGGRR